VDEFAAGTAQLKLMASGESQEIAWGGEPNTLADAVAAAVAAVRKSL
jgi:hypothetical protein